MTELPTLPRDDKPVISPDRTALVTTLIHLWPYIWPAERRDLKLRVAAAMVLLLVAKLATIAVPFTFKWATDALVGEGTAPVAANSWLVWVFAAPVLMTVAYGGTPILMGGVSQGGGGGVAQGGVKGGGRVPLPPLQH